MSKREANTNNDLSAHPKTVQTDHARLRALDHAITNAHGAQYGDVIEAAEAYYAFITRRYIPKAAPARLDKKRRTR